MANNEKVAGLDPELAFWAIIVIVPSIITLITREFNLVNNFIELAKPAFAISLIGAIMYPLINADLKYKQ